MMHRVLYIVRHKKEETSNQGNRVITYENKTEIEEFPKIKEARKRFHELRQKQETGNNELPILKIKLQVQAISITGTFWKDLLISDCNK